MKALSILVIAGLSLGAVTAVTAEEGASDNAAVTTNKSSDASQISRGARAWSNQCARCHNMRSPSEKQDYEWDISVNHMRLITNMPPAMAEDIKAFLKSSN